MQSIKKKLLVNFEIILQFEGKDSNHFPSLHDKNFASGDHKIGLRFSVYADVDNGAAEGHGAVPISRTDWGQVGRCRRRPHPPSMC